MDREDIIDLFPEIKMIKNDRLRQGVVDIWLLAVKRGNWTRIDDIPFTLLIKTKKTLIQHTRCVTQMAMAIARLRDDVDMDEIIAGGLVHDVGKLLEYKKVKGCFTKSEPGKRVRHPISGYGLAVEIGLPWRIGHIIAAHSEEGDKVKRTAEAVIIHHCDFVDFDIVKGQ